MKNKIFSVFIILLLTISSVTVMNLHSAEVNVYSFRQQFLIQPILDRYQEKYNTKVNVIFSKKGLVERIKLEGKNSPADVILTTDIGQLIDLEKANVLGKFNSPIVKKIIPKSFRSKNDLWFGLTTRA